MDNQEKLLSAGEVALVFGVTTATIYRWNKRGLLPCVRVGRLVRFRRRDVERVQEAKQLK